MKWIPILLLIMIGLAGCAFPASSNSTVLLNTATPTDSAGIVLAQGDMEAASPPPVQDVVQTAIALTQLAGNAQQLSAQDIQTAIASTLVALNPQAVANQQIQTAIAQTQVAASNPLSPEQIQTAIAMTQAVQLAAMPPVLQQAGVTPTPAPQPMAGGDPFSGAYIYKFGSLGNRTYLITIQLSSSVSGDYHAKVADQTYECEIQKDYPNRLYCRGKAVRGGQRSVTVLEDGTEKIVFVGDLTFPVWTPTLVHMTPETAPCRSKPCQKWPLLWTQNAP